MKFTLSWLKDHLLTEASIEEIIEKLTMIGLEVEETKRFDIDRSGFFIARAYDVKKHPYADKLQTCLVDAGDSQQYQVVCGADNLTENMLGVFAKIGSRIPNGDFILKKTKIRGVESEGMLLSEFELGISNNHDGIIKLADKSLKIGDDFAKTSGFDDPVIEIAVTPNRSDCLGVYGIARDLAAAEIGELIPLRKTKIQSKHDGKKSFSISNDAVTYCDRIAYGSVYGIDNKTQTPDLIKNRLIAIGQKTISPLVDISNYLMFDIARPFHFYDCAKIKSKSLNIDLASNVVDKTFEALDNKKYQLEANDLVIIDKGQIVGLAGIIGGKSTAVDSNTKDVLIEVADFSQNSITKTARRLNIDTEAQRRFSRGIDKAFLDESVLYAQELILKICAGSASSSSFVGGLPRQAEKISLSLDKLNSFANLDIDKNKAAGILNKLGFKVDIGSNSLETIAPSWRNDIFNDQCLIEEIIRMIGLDNIPVKVFKASHQEVDYVEDNNHKIKDRLVNLGYFETINWTFTDRKSAELVEESYQQSDLILVKNPISSEQGVMRPSLLPNMLRVVQENIDRKEGNLSIFELGPKFFLSDKSLAEDSDNKAKIVEQNQLCCLAVGQKVAANWLDKQRLVDSFDVKADLFSILSILGLPTKRLSFDYKLENYYHKGLSANLMLGDRKIASFGILDKLFLANFNIEERVACFEINFAKLPPIKNKKSKKDKLVLINFPSVQRDLAFILAKNIPSLDVIKEIQRLKNDYIKDIWVFDQYYFKDDKKLKSLAFRFKLESDSKTLNETEINQTLQIIIDKVCSSFSARLRDS